ncbi:MAG TPA: right-handed parallel beta-helix repeat-containing protein [Candidatus Binatia bacterium]|jgi:cysteine-rich repeat protein|nr:right-handed parallel beta-helix repeat-containing protein [Candidatus Binatia bacterium]
MRVVALLLALVLPVHAAVYTVAPSGGDFTSVQAALDVAMPSDTVQVRTGVYAEKVVLPRSGTAGNPIVLRAYTGETPVLDGTSVPGDSMVLIENRSWVQVIGLTLQNNLGVTDGSGIRVLGAGSHIELRQNRIHAMRGTNAMGITVYGTASAAISDLLVDGNEIVDCEPAPSEALTLNGNVDGFAVTNNVVRDVDNIGIDMIGGETDIQPDPTKVARNGVVRGNTVTRARSSYGGGFAGGIYVDGGRDITIEHNVVTESDLGMEIGAENGGTVTRDIVVRDNVLYANEKACLVFGGYAPSTGRVRDSVFSNNTCWGNDTLGAGFGELWIQYAEDNVIRNNVFHATSAGLLLLSEGGNVGNLLSHNLWFTTGAPRFVWNGDDYGSLGAYQAATGQDVGALFANPLLVDPGNGDVHLAPGSPARDAGDPAFVPAPGETDVDGAARVNGPRVDIGADEATTCGNNVTEPPEACDDGDLVSGDGCDANCTVTACGNGVVTAGEQCDDGNLVAGDCCGAACQFEATGTPCDDGDTCSHSDTCTAGVCAGDTVPAPSCRDAGSGSFLLRNGTPDTKDALTWKWTKGAATTLADLGAPASGATSYTLCVYDAGGVLLRARAPGGGTCAGKPCWKSVGASGFKYADRGLTPDGLLSMRIKPGAAGKASITLKGKGGLLPMPVLPAALPVTVQLHDGLACWETVHGAPAQRNDGGQFSDRAD